MRRRGYVSVGEAWLIVSLKSPQMRTLPFFLRTGTIGAAQAECLTGEIIPLDCN